MSDDPLLELARDFKRRSELQIGWLSSLCSGQLIADDEPRLEVARSLIEDFRTVSFMLDVSMVDSYSRDQRAITCEKAIERYREAVDQLFAFRMAGLDRQRKP